MDLSNCDAFNQTKPSLENETDWELPRKDYVETSYNETNCELPWEDYVETSEDSNVDIVILVCILLTLFFDTFLIAIILLHDDLRKKVRISGYILEVTIFLLICWLKGRFSEPGSPGISNSACRDLE